MIAIAAAMSEELAPIHRHLEKKEVSQTGPTIISKGIYKSIPVLVVQTGIGKANAAASTAILLERYAPEAIFNVGTAGGLSRQTQVGDVVVAAQSLYADVDATCFGYSLGQVPQMPAFYAADSSLLETAERAAKSWQNERNVHVGLILTSDAFMSDLERVQSINASFPAALAADMESAAVAQIALAYQIPFLNIRTISDIGGENAGESFDENIDSVPQQAISFLEAVLDSLLLSKA